MSKITIVMSYYNRRDQLLATLSSIQRSIVKSKDVIVVDDGSDAKHDISDISSGFNYPVTVIKIDKAKKWWVNPCVPFNIGFKKAHTQKSDLIMIQNPECLHCGDILDHAVKHVTQKNYISYACNRAKTKATDCILKMDKNLSDKEFVEQVKKCTLTGGRWYNHPIVRPYAYHFCSVMSRENLKLLRGFDQRFAFGHSYDDDDLVIRIRRGIGLRIQTPDPQKNPYAIHLNHEGTLHAGVPSNRQLFFKIHPNYKRQNWINII